MNQRERKRAAKALFPMTCLAQVAKRLAAMSPALLDYITQAPVIVGALLPREKRVYRADGCYRYSSTNDPLNNFDFRRRLLALCISGAKLRDVLALCNINPGLRGLDRFALSSSTHEDITALRDANPSSVAQQIAKRTPQQQREYLRAVDYWESRVPWLTGAPGKPTVAWMIDNLPPEAPDMPHIRDLFSSRPEWNASWKWRDLQAHMRKWEESFTQMSESLVRANLTNIFRGNQPMLTPDARITAHMVYTTTGVLRQPGKSLTNTPLTPHTDAPGRWVVDDGHAFVLLNTEVALADEGARLSHCVADYAEKVRMGGCLIYSLRTPGDVSLATLELVPGPRVEAAKRKDQTWSISQFKCYRNRDPAARYHAMLDLFTHANFTIRNPRSEPMSYGREPLAMREPRMLMDRMFQEMVVEYVMDAMQIPRSSRYDWEVKFMVPPRGGLEMDVVFDEIIRMAPPTAVGPEDEIPIHNPRPRHETYHITTNAMRWLMYERQRHDRYDSTLRPDNNRLEHEYRERIERDRYAVRIEQLADRSMRVHQPHYRHYDWNI